MGNLQVFARSLEQKKLLLMPRYVKENEILFQICREIGETTVNLEVASLIDLAQECYLWQQTMRGEVAKHFSNEQGTLLVMSILQELDREKQLLFFSAGMDGCANL